MNPIYRLLNTQQGLAIGDYATVEEAWEAVKKVKGRMVLWEMSPAPAGWTWKQKPLKFIPWRSRMLFEAKKKLAGWWR